MCVWMCERKEETEVDSGEEFKGRVGDSGEESGSELGKIAEGGACACTPRTL